MRNSRAHAILQSGSAHYDITVETGNRFDSFKNILKLVDLNGTVLATRTTTLKQKFGKIFKLIIK